MKREITFRAWTEQGMLYTAMSVIPCHLKNKYNDIKLFTPIVVMHNRVETWFLESKLGDLTDGYFDHPIYIPYKYIMQYTGLKDKNGKEIYEGDIMQIDDVKNFVVYTLCSFRFNGYMARGLQSNLYEASLIGEVIGNIYSDPSLLNQQ